MWVEDQASHWDLDDVDLFIISDNAVKDIREVIEEWWSDGRRTRTMNNDDDVLRLPGRDPITPQLKRNRVANGSERREVNSRHRDNRHSTMVRWQWWRLGGRPWAWPLVDQLPGTCQHACRRRKQTTSASCWRGTRHWSNNQDGLRDDYQLCWQRDYKMIAGRWNVTYTSADEQPRKWVNVRGGWSDGEENGGMQLYIGSVATRRISRNRSTLPLWRVRLRWTLATWRESNSRSADSPSSRMHWRTSSDSAAASDYA